MHKKLTRSRISFLTIGEYLFLAELIISNKYSALSKLSENYPKFSNAWLCMSISLNSSEHESLLK
jgi:hypothetical protein